MRLKRLTLHGFKSFADKTTFAFDRPVTCVVGPNGCGKSNVVDAIKWVLGEQSAKSLRGGAMLDVIFNGADARKPAAMAEVELVFENPKREAGGRLLNLDTDEVSVARRLYRDGTSEYRLNNAAGRLRDVRDLFLDTGIGVDAYSIIEQGRVARLLEANPVERRQIFEEAAGISRFKVRKKEAERKLERVDQNLGRLTDIVQDLEKRLRGVRVQAGRARSYQELATRLGELRLKHALHEYHTLQGKLADLTKREADARFRADDAAGDLTRAETELADARRESDERQQARQKASHDLVETRGKVQQAAQKADYARRQGAQVEEQAKQLGGDREAMAGRLAEAERLLAEVGETLAALTEQVTTGRAGVDGQMQRHRADQLRANDLNRTIEQHKAAYLDAMRRLAGVEGRLNAIEIERRNAAGNADRLDARRQVLDDEQRQHEAKRDEATAAIAATVAAIGELQQGVEAKTAEAAGLGGRIKRLTELLGRAREQRSGLLSRQKLLQDLENKREGVSDAVQWVLKRRAERFGFLRGLVADVLRVDVEHAGVIEAALDGRDQWLVAAVDADLLGQRGAFDGLPGRVNVLRAEPVELVQAVEPEPVEEPSLESVGSPVVLRAEWIADGARVEFIPHRPAVGEPDVATFGVAGELVEELATTSGVVGSPSPRLAPVLIESKPDARRRAPAEFDWSRVRGPVRFALDLVRYEPEDRVIADNLLGRTAIVATLDEAASLHREGPAGWRYVTRGGEVVEADGTYRAGPLGAAMGLLSRRSELEALAHQIAEADGRIAALQRELAGGNEQAKQLDAAVAAMRQDVHRLNTQRVEQNGQLQQAESRLAAIGRERPLIDRESENLAKQVAKLDAEAEGLAGQRRQWADKQASSQAEAERLTGEQAALAEQLKREAEALTAARVALGQLEEKQLGAKQAVQRHESGRREFGQQIERIDAAIASLDGRRRQAADDLQHAQHAGEQLQARVAELARHVDELDDALATLADRVRDAASRVEAARTTRGAIEQEAHHLQIALSETTVRVESLVTRTREEIAVELPEKYAEACGSASAAMTQATEGASGGEASVAPTESMDWDAVAREIKDLKDRIQRLGNVNLDALDELAQLEKDFTTNGQQLDDLTTSKRQLEELIDQINKESGVRFAETFEAVRGHFQQMFRKLFGGGKADVVLETELEDRRAVLPEGADPTSGPVMRRVDPLDAGIEVIARPPGKNPVALSQLSGGEKAMTCIALLMSIFKAKPSPFCILDEVDAPLDEANNQRFGLIVQEFLDTSQFIIITHHKKTMQIADALYGITQQVQGVSTRVPVRFDQVEAGGRIKAEAVEAAREAEEVAA